MKRALAAAVLLAAVAVGAALLYQAASRDRQYRALVARGDAALRDDQTFGAIEAYSGAIALRPDSMLAHLRRGETYQRRGDLEGAARDFLAAASLDPTATRPLDELGDVLYQMQRVRRAAETYEAYLRLDDRSPRVTYKLALARYRDGNIDGALAALTQAVRLDDRMADAHYLAGLCLRAKGRLGEAEQEFAKAIVLSPGMIPAREELADLYQALGRPNDELAQLQVIAGLDRDHIERQVAVGLAHARAGHADLAVLTLGSALERTPAEPAVYEALGKVWLDIAESRKDRVALSKAVEALTRAATGNSPSSDVLTLYGRALLDDNQTDAAEPTLRQATERFPIAPASFIYYANAAERLNRFDAARQALIQYGAIVMDDPDFAARAARIAGLSLKLNDTAAAVHWFQRAAETTPNDVRVLASLADAQMKAGDREAAQATVARGLEKDPRSPLLLPLARRLGVTPAAAVSDPNSRADRPRQN